LTTPESEPDPYAGGEPQSWRTQPVVPGWSAGQDWYAGPHYDDTGWQIDLSNVDWGDDARYDRQAPPDAPFPYEGQQHQAGNGVRPSPADYDWPADDRASRPDERPGGRHARGGRAGADPLPPGRPGYRTRPARGPVWEEPPAADSARTGREPANWDEGMRGPVRERRQWDYGDRGPDSPPTGRGVREGYRPDPLGPDGYESGGYPPGSPARPDGQDLQSRPDWPEAPRGPDTRRGPDGLRRPDGQRGPDGLRRPEGQRPAGMRRVSARPPAGYADTARPGGPGVGARRSGPGGAYADATDGYTVRPRPEPARPLPAGRRRDDTGTMSIVRSSSVMAVGTLASRLTGFLRTLVQAFALGGAWISIAYNTANTLPNVVYNLALGGILTSVIVPLIVSAGRRDADGGESYDQRMFTLITFALLGITLAATIAAAPIADLYKGAITGRQLHVLVIFAYFFIPQIFFYGMSSLISAVLNARRSFAAPMWTPVINNVVVIVVLGMYLAIAGPGRTMHITSGQVELLGVGTTIGIVAQTLALVPALRHVGFRWLPRFDFRRVEIYEIGRMAGWLFCYIAATQVAFLVTTKVANEASAMRGGFTDYTYAWQLFQLPYAIVGISVITALLPRMSTHASERRLGLVRNDFSTGVRLASAIVVPCSLVLAVLGPALARVLFGHGAFASEARNTGVVFAFFCLGLLPYMLFQLQLRVFYALRDSRTPAFIGLATMTMNIVANYVALAVLPKSEVVAGLGIGFGLANLLGSVLAWRILTRRLRGLDGWLIGRSLVRMHAATLPAALIVILVGLLTPNPYTTVIIGGGLAVLLYLAFARALRIEELTRLTSTVMSRLRR
jgi:putative peptidoglycan lipid II flippase